MNQTGVEFPRLSSLGFRPTVTESVLGFNFTAKTREMSGLADELLADLEGLSGGEEEEQEEPQSAPPKASSSTLPQKRKATDDAPSSSLADDLEDDDDDDDEDREMAPAEEEMEASNRREVGSLVLEGGVRPADELDAEDVQQMELGGIEDVTKIAKLEGSKRMTEILKVCTPCLQG